MPLAMLSDNHATLGRLWPTTERNAAKRKGGRMIRLPVLVKAISGASRIIQLDNPLLIVRCYSAAIAAISTDTYLRPSFPPWNRTRPAESANKV